MRVNDLTGKEYGSLKVVAFDSERYEKDMVEKRRGSNKRIRRYYLCECSLCGRVVSVRGENLVSGNTKGCGCDMYKKGAAKRHERCLNEYEYSADHDCYIGTATNTDNKFFVDKDDIGLVMGYCWYETADGYMMTRVGKDRQVFMHRLILSGGLDDTTSGIVDHINRNRLDNRKSNLRVCSPLENVRNRTVRHDSKSQITGVRIYENGARPRWQAYICVHSKFISLGYYDTIDEAANARKEAERKYFGEFAPV